MGPPPLTNSDTTPRMEPDRIRTCEGAMPAVLQTVELLSGSLLEHHTGTAPVPKLWKSLIILLDQWCLERDRSTDLDRLALILQIITLSKDCCVYLCIFNLEKESIYPDSNRSFLTGNEKCYHYIIYA